MKKVDWFYFRAFPALFTCIVLATGMNKLALMQTEHLLSLGAAVLTYLFAMTSILYARARTATDPDVVLIRSLTADECLKTAVLASFATGVIAFVFFTLSQNHAAVNGHVLDGKAVPETAPAIWAGISVLLFLPITVKFEYVVSMIAQDLGLMPPILKATVSDSARRN